MNKTILCILGISAIALFSCKNEPKNTDPNLPAGYAPGETADPTVLAGHWIDLDFCARASQYGSVLQTENNSHLPYAYAFTFAPANPDSVTCYNAYETWNVPVKYKKDTLELVGAVQGKKSIFLVYHSHGDKDMTMFDNTGGTIKMDNFIKSKAGTKTGYEAFTTALNHQLFSGQFTPIIKGKTDEKVMFTPGGFLQGMKDFDRFEVCTGGDCFVTGQAMDVIMLYNAKKGRENSEKMFGYQYNGHNDTLSFYTLIDMKPGQKGESKIGPVAYKFARQFSVPAPRTNKNGQPGQPAQQQQSKPTGK